jgi:hypothetical protein
MATDLGTVLELEPVNFCAASAPACFGFGYQYFHDTYWYLSAKILNLSCFN